MSRQCDLTLSRYRLDNFFADGLSVVCDPDLDSSSPSNVSEFSPPEYLITAPLGFCCHQIMPAGSIIRGQPPVEGTGASHSTESDPLIPGTHLNRRPFYRARPLWLVPFAITVALARGMTLAPKVEVYTQLSCRSVYGHRPTLSNAESLPQFIPAFVSPETPQAPYYPSTFFNLSSNFERLPLSTRSTESSRCLTDPVVQAATARLQTLVTTIMGLLSALTTGWWGNFSERYGRTRVLAISTFSLFLSDLIFVLASTPSSPLSHHGHRFLLLAPFVEGLFGGPGALQSATSAYVSDCTSPGSRATIFSRFAGVTYLGIAIGPTAGAWFIRHPFFQTRSADSHTTQTVASVFVVSIVCLFLNFVLAAFVIPESLSREKQTRAKEEYAGVTSKSKGKARSHEEDCQRVARAEESSMQIEDNRGVVGVFRRLFGPLAVFLPVDTIDFVRLRKKTDWSLTILAIGLFGYYISQSVYQLKYLYAEHTYGWGAEQLGYYISFLGGTRALFLLFVLPSVISIFKPGIRNSKKALRTISAMSQGLIVERVHPSLSPIVPPSIDNSLKQGKKGAGLTKSQLAKEIAFDLTLAKISFLVEIMSDILIAIIPTPKYLTHTAGHAATKQYSKRASEMLFVMASSLSCFGTGVSPSTQSLALCILQVRGMSHPDTVETGGSAGALFGAFAVLQAVGTTILGPILFGLVYSESVAKFPKAVFTLGAAILFIGFLLMMLVNNPGDGVVGPSKIRRGKANVRHRKYVDIERGRSRVSKDLRGGAIPNYSYLE